MFVFLKSIVTSRHGSRIPHIWPILGSFFLTVAIGTPIHADTKDTPAEVVVLFFGDSLTAGYGLSEEDAYPAHVEKLAAGAGHRILAINAGLSGETTAGGARRIGWVLRRPIDVMVLALGGNDGLRGIDPEETRRNLTTIIQRARAEQPHLRILLTGMQAPPNMGEAYTQAFREVFEEVANTENVAFLPFLLESVGGDPSRNLPDGIHPNPEGHQIIAQTVWDNLKPLLTEK